MIDPETWVRVHQQDREREMHAAQRASLLRGTSGRTTRRTPTRPIGGSLSRAVGRTLVRVGLWLIVAE